MFIFNKNLLALLFCLPFFYLSPDLCRAQKKADLEITAQHDDNSIRGGEEFSYQFTIRNLSAEVANDVQVINHFERLARFVSITPSQGDCEIGTYVYALPEARCSLGALAGNSAATISVTVKADDYGDASQTKNRIEELTAKDSITTRRLIEAQGLTMNDITEQRRRLEINATVYAQNNNENDENNRARFSVSLLPSRNIPPRLEILSPQNKSIVLKPEKGTFDVVLRIKAFDSDGKIVKVIVNDQSKFVYENGAMKLVLGGKTFSGREIEKNQAEIEKLTTAVAVGNNIYTYTLKNLASGQNHVVVSIIDDGGRSTSQSVYFEVKGDPAIKTSDVKKEN